MENLCHLLHVAAGGQVVIERLQQSGARLELVVNG